MKENLSADDRCVIIGWNLAKQPNGGLTWLYSHNEKLNGVDPKFFLESGGDPTLVEDAFRGDFEAELEYPDFSKPLP